MSFFGGASWGGDGWEPAPEDIQNPDDLNAWFLGSSKPPADPCDRIMRCNCSEGSSDWNLLGQQLNWTRQALHNVSARCGDGGNPFHEPILLPEMVEGEESIFTKEIGPWEFRMLPQKWILAVNVVGYVGIFLGLLGLLRLLGGFRRTLWGWWRQEKVSPAVQRKLMAFKAGQLRLLVRMACCLLMPITAWLPAMRLPYSLQSSPVVSLAQNVLGLLTLYPEAISAGSLDAVFCCLALLVTVAVTPMTCSETDLLPTLLMANCLMLALIAVRRTTPIHCPLLLLMSFLFGAAASSTIFLRGRFAFGTSRRAIAAAQGLFALLLTAVGPVLERASRERTLALLELEELRGLVRASRSLLRSCFDVVVELDASGRVVSKGQELGALLLRESSRQCLEGADFLELVEDVDARSALKARFAEPEAESAGLAESMQLSMRDACQNFLRLEVMWFGFKRLGDEGSERCFMMGLRESCEQPRQQREPPPALVALQSQSHVRSQSRRRSRVSMMALSVSESSSLQEDEASSGSSHVDGGALLVVDTGSADFPVLRASTAFRTRICRVQRGRPLRCLVARRQNFEDWLVEVAMARRAGKALPRDRKVLFEAPQGKVQAMCRALRHLPLQDGQQESQQQPLLFYDIRLLEDLERARPLANRGTSPLSAPASLEEQRSQQGGGEQAQGRRRHRRSQPASKPESFGTVAL